MIKSNKASLGAIALALGGLAVMCAADAPDRAVSAGAKASDKAVKALRKHHVEEAIAAAEQAVAVAPREPGYRMVLGQSYLQAGRFQSAAQAFADVLALAPQDGKAALNLALAQVATGDWQGARRTLAAHEADIPASDRGLAMALTGDTAGAVTLLTGIARSPDATPKVRQNLALSYALAGQWALARVVAAADMSPADVDARLAQWAAFAQPNGAADQVASLLGVKPTADRGQPVTLALNAPTPVMPVAATEAAAVAATAPVPVAATTTPTPQIAFAPHQEVVQPITALLIRRASGSFRTPVVARPVEVARVVPAKPAMAHQAAAHGSWVVQLGAFSSAGVAKDAWGRATQRFAAFAGHRPQGMSFKAASATFYRLSVGGFSRSEADQTCRQYRARGGACFVRAGAGDQVATWVKPVGTQVASR